MKANLLSMNIQNELHGHEYDALLTWAKGAPLLRRAYIFSSSGGVV